MGGNKCAGVVHNDLVRYVQHTQYYSHMQRTILSPTTITLPPVFVDYLVEKILLFLWAPARLNHLPVYSRKCNVNSDKQIYERYSDSRFVNIPPVQ